MKTINPMKPTTSTPKATVKFIKPVQLNPDNALMTVLFTAFAIRRPHKSRAVLAFTEWLQAVLPEHLRDIAFVDSVGNLHIDARTDIAHRTLFVAHVDTVHRTEGMNKFTVTKQQITAALPGECLGADDGAGVAMLMHMIWGGVPGYYVFTQGEECGGIGAKHLADKYDDLLIQFDRAIAFDRKGQDSVITHQGWGRCCSDTFAQALADALITDDTWFVPDDTGVYTDTAEFIELIPECTNISIGYEGAHSERESLDLLFFNQLADQVMLVDWDALPTERDPSVVEEKDYGWEYDWKSAVIGGSWDHEKKQWDYGYESKGTTNSKWDMSDSYMDSRLKRLYSRDMELEDAIADARIGMYNPLISLIAEAVSPDDPSIAKKNIRKQALDEPVLNWAEDMFDQGFDADSILEELYQCACTH